MINRVKIKEIENIKKRLILELEDENSPLPTRKKDIESLIYRLNDWLDERENREREHYREVIQSES